MPYSWALQVSAEVASQDAEARSVSLALELCLAKLVSPVDELKFLHSDTLCNRSDVVDSFHIGPLS